MKFLGAMLLTLGLAACGSLQDDSQDNQLGNEIGKLAGGLLGGNDAAQADSGQVGRDELLANPGKYIRVNQRSFNIWDTMVQAASNGPRVTWVGVTRTNVTFENGIVVGTRGLPRDLMGAAAAQVWPAIRAGGGNYQRVHEYLGDDDQPLTRAMQCQLTADGPDPLTRLDQTQPARKFTESCAGDGLQISNIYWVSPAGRMLRSLQAISPEAGYLQIDVF